MTRLLAIADGFQTLCCTLVVLSLVLVQLVHGRAEFRDRIPNGYNVRDSAGLAWPGVGHFRAAGSGARNPFGEDFAAAGLTWTVDLCRKDSDGDGASNGAELGDPNCVWVPGATPTGPALSHPGFAGDAQGSIDTCKNFIEPAGSRNLTIQFSTPFQLPAGEVTSYPRQAFNLSALAGWVPGDNHFSVRFEQLYGGPIEVVHHIVIYWCDLADIINGGYTFGGPPITGGGLCSRGIIYAWAIGGSPFCIPAQHGLPLLSSNPYILLEVHMNNAAMNPNVQSRPGFLVTVVPENAISPPNSMIKVHWVNLGVQLDKLRIPPGHGYVEITTNFTLPTFLPPGYLTMFASFSHMHWLGRKVWVERRPAQTDAAPQSMACNPTYSNEDQEVVPIDPPLNITNGDQIVLHCVFNSSERVNVTKGGEETADEMCFVFFLFNSNLFDGPLEGFGDPTVTTTPQFTTTECTASSTLGGLTTAGLDIPPWLLAHIVCAGLGFGFLMPLGALFPASRNFRAKHPEGWFLGHRILMCLALVLGATAFGLAVSQRPMVSRFTTNHGKMGIALLSLVMVQILMGMLRPHLPEEGVQKSTRRKAFEWGHPTIGWVIMGCIATQLYWGYDLLYAGYSPYSSLLVWRIIHSMAFFVLWAIVMVFLHPPPFLQKQRPALNPANEKQIQSAV